MTETYKACLLCRNCREYQEVDIRKGVTIAEYIKLYVCILCECDSGFDLTVFNAPKKETKK